MKVAVLFSGGKDSCFAAFLAKKYGHDIECLISIISKNKESYMFHTPSILNVKKQAEIMGLPLILQQTEGRKELELNDLEKAMKTAITKYKIQGIVTGAIESVYQASRVQKICDKLKLECFNPLWQKDSIELLNDLIKNKFKVIITGVFAYPLDKTWLEREINERFIEDVKKLREKYKVHPAGEGGEFETFVLDCPLFKNSLKIKDRKIYGTKNSWAMDLEI